LGTRAQTSDPSPPRGPPLRTLQRLSLIWRRFSPLEERLLREVRAVLSPSAQRTLDAQVAAITKVQRAPGWTEIAFYRMRAGKVDWSGVPLFAREVELPLAEVRFRAAGRAYRARLTAIRGHIFDFAITPGARAVAFEPWEGEADVRLLADPEALDTPDPREELPDAWLRVVARGVQAHPDWDVHEAHSVHRVALEQGEFLVLAEHRGESFLLYRLAPEPGFFLLRGHDGEPEAVRGSVEELLAAAPPPAG
jgi:hypothetical protein